MEDPIVTSFIPMSAIALLFGMDINALEIFSRDIAAVASEPDNGHPSLANDWSRISDQVADLGPAAWFVAGPYVRHLGDITTHVRDFVEKRNATATA